jgi:hypothetical protein
MGNSHKGEASRLIVSGGIEAAGFSKLSIVVTFAAHPRSGEVRYA